MNSPSTVIEVWVKVVGNGNGPQIQESQSLSKPNPNFIPNNLATMGRESNFDSGS